MRSRLRQATEAEHGALDRVVEAYDLSASEAYARFLARHALATLPLEAALDRAGCPAWLPDWPSRRRGGALIDDLHSLGVAAPSAPVAEIPDAAFGWGVLYVLEGSRLGGRLLHERARAGGDPAVLAAGRYLSHGDKRDWPTFLAALEAAAPPAARPATAEAGARFAFERYCAAFETEKAAA